MGEHAAKVAPDLATLPSLSHADLKSQWTETFGAVPPKGLSRRLLICALAYEVQTKDQGRLKPATRKQLVEIATSDTPESASEASPLTPGTRLMREWRGTVHVVDVTEGGLVWNGRIYASLSAIARTITGTRWSGQRFFGLRKRSDAIASGAPPTRAANPEGVEDLSSSSGKSARTNNPGIGNGAFRRPDDTGAELAAKAKAVGQTPDYNPRATAEPQPKPAS